MGGQIPSLPDPYNLALFRFPQKALTNIVKHAGASQVWVKVHNTGERIGLSVQDDGNGFTKPLSGKLTTLIERKDGSQGMGLQGMQERINLLNGEVEIETQPGQGSRITAWLSLLSQQVFP